MGAHTGARPYVSQEGVKKIKMKKAHKSGKKNNENLMGFLFSLPCIIGFICFSLLPMLISFALSFTDYKISMSPKFIGIDNYYNLFRGNSPYFYQSLKVTFLYVFISVPLAIAFSFVVALLLNQPIKGKAIFRTIFYMPSVLPLVAMSSIWVWIFNPDLGLANSLLKQLGLPTSQWIYGSKSVLPTLIGLNLWNTGSTIVIFLAGLQDVPRQYLEAVEIDGGGVMAKLRHVIIPLMTPTIFFNLVMGFINGFQSFVQAYVMTYGGPDNKSLFYVYFLYREAFQFSRLGSACAIAWVLFLIIAVFTAILFRNSKKWVYYMG